jgi:hypothetical protein
LIEVTPDKKVAWTLRDWTTFGPASSTQLLDEREWRKNPNLQRDSAQIAIWPTPF